jgi:glycosyltransferase involved in cell wall biosynthesis
LSGKSGLLWTDDDPVTLSRLIVELLGDEKRRELMGSAGRAFVERFSAPRIVAEFELLLQSPGRLGMEVPAQ